MCLCWGGGPCLTTHIHISQNKHKQELGSGSLAEGLPSSSSAAAAYGGKGEGAQACAWDPHDPNKVAVLQGPALVQWDLRTFKCVRVFGFWVSCMYVVVVRLGSSDRPIHLLNPPAYIHVPTHPYTIQKKARGPNRARAPRPGPGRGFQPEQALLPRHLRGGPPDQILGLAPAGRAGEALGGAHALVRFGSCVCVYVWLMEGAAPPSG